jgi:hypothetical protein
MPESLGAHFICYILYYKYIAICLYIVIYGLARGFEPATHIFNARGLYCAGFCLCYVICCLMRGLRPLARF